VPRRRIGGRATRSQRDSGALRAAVDCLSHVVDEQRPGVSVHGIEVGFEKTALKVEEGSKVEEGLKVDD